ncbi:MAG: family 78 glycoside hydrolase catalytic domain, partial [Phycisphaeraceae bacterium]|nr:family 78 glycoside hydrolase catalytic domain [Phycisphaeraceae bacterium]
PADPAWEPVGPDARHRPEDRTVLKPRPVKRLIDGGTTAATVHTAGTFRRDPALIEAEFEQSPEREDRVGLILADGSHASPGWLMQHDRLDPLPADKCLSVPAGTALADASDGIRPTIDRPAGADGFFLLLDLGRQEVGLLELEIDAPAGTIVDIGYGEHLDDQRVRTRIGGRNFAGRYICREGRQTFTHYFLRWAGRYLQLHIQANTFTLHRCHLRRRDYPIEMRGAIDLGDARHDAIAAVARRTLHLCMHEHYEDTPWREQALYANDARIQALCGYYAFGEYDFPRSSFDLLGRGLREDGWLELTAPARPKVTIPSFTLVWMLAVRDHYLYSGDSSLAQAMLDQMTDMLEALLDQREDGLLPLSRTEGIWHFYDWSEGMSGYGDEDFQRGLAHDAPLNCFLILALEAVAEIRSWLGQPDPADVTDTLDQLRAAATDAFWDPDAGLFKTHPHTDRAAALTQALAVLAGLGDEASRKTVLGHLHQHDDNLVQPTLSQSFYTFQARMSDKARGGQSVIADIADTWGQMLDAGATTFWETIDGGDAFNNAGSLCHGWSAVPLYVYYHDLVGIQPTAPGFRSFTVNPLTAGLGEGSARVPVPGGAIDARWQNGKLEVVAPDTCERVAPG